MKILWCPAKRLWYYGWNSRTFEPMWVKSRDSALRFAPDEAIACQRKAGMMGFELIVHDVVTGQ